MAKPPPQPKTLAELGTPGVARDPRTSSTYPGQADWGQAGSSHSCRECLVWGFADEQASYFAATGMLKPRQCMVYVVKMPSPHPAVPHYARSCRCFVPNPEPPPVERQRKENAP